MTSTRPSRGRGLRRLRRSLLTLVLLAGTFQAGRLAERAIWPCRLQPVAALVAPLLGQRMPGPKLCDLLLRLPGV